LQFVHEKKGGTTVKHFGMMFAMCMFAAAVGAEQPAPAPAATPAPTAPPTAGAPPAATAPPVASGLDAAVVKGGEFDSSGFKFHYTLPTGWKALDDAKRVAANQQLRDQYAHPVHNPNMPASKKQAAVKKSADPATKNESPPTSTAPKRPTAPAIPNNFSLMVASPNGVDSVDSAVLPRINIWANHKIPALSNPKDRAAVLESLGRVVLPTTLVTLAGREFARVEVLHAGGPYHSLWVTAVGDYLIGFDVRASSDPEMQTILESMRSVRFD
jgi:hypothetical protein